MSDAPTTAARTRRLFRAPPPPFRSDPLWYKDAIIYEVPVRAFYDADGDGTGDVAGLTAKLDYLVDLGVTALWLLPFYPSPLRDDGYDISDYNAVHPAYGTVEDVKHLLEEAHRRGLYVITELVCNHTSDRHAWFQRARRASPGSLERDFYVWSDTTARFAQARVIFKDFETSNWTWDPVARAYYWHRFYAHQPDLNFDNPEVREAIVAVVDFWLGMGVDGLRLDAVPYLFEREGTSCENLPETHAFLRALRRHVDERFPGRLLLAEANQWPEDAAAYFGQGDECHMAFHFPLMPRLFMALRMEDRFPIVDILAQTPPTPPAAQWGLFLRNHDELTLEMVTDEERDYMYRAYAQDAHARINLGIRRRLAPLLGNNRRRIELMNALLFSLPGTPFIYYGDEIGMGDNIYLGDRNGVRTPMQWSPERNAGFSKASRQRLYLPLILDPEYHYDSTNVETQQQNPHSLLWWMKRLIALRRSSRAFGRGTLEVLQPDNFKVLAFVRRHEDETILVVANLSRFAQHANVDLSLHRGLVPVEMMGRVAFPRIGPEPYAIMLGPHSFYWFSLEDPAAQGATGSDGAPPVLDAEGIWSRSSLERALLAFLPGRRWFAGKGRRLVSARIVEEVALGAPDVRALLVDVATPDGPTARYSVPLSLAGVPREAAGAVVATVPGPGGSAEGARALVDALRDEGACRRVLEAIAEERVLPGASGELRGHSSAVLRSALSPGGALPPPSIVPGEQSNTSVVFGAKLILKLFRRLEPGINPDVEMGRFLGERGFVQTPRIAGTLEYVPRRGDPCTVGVVHELVANEGDAWRHALDALEHLFERLLTRPGGPAAPPPLVGHLVALAADGLPPDVAETLGPQLEQARVIGRRTAELHVALASEREDPAFAPEPFSPLYQRSLYQSLRNLAGHVLRQARSALADERDEGVRSQLRCVLDAEGTIQKRFRRLVERKVEGLRIRCHGDYHLGQVLWTGKDAVIIDFEGEPGRPIEERRIKRTPLRDVAGMVRSYHYAAVTALAKRGVREQDAQKLRPWARHWYLASSSTFLRAYVGGAAQDPRLLPESGADQELLLDTHLLAKALYELGYELANRPDWTRIACEGVLELADTPEGSA